MKVTKEQNNKGGIARLHIDEARVLFPNFSGTPSQFNARGERTFSILIEDPIIARELIADGWNIKELTAQEDMPPAYHLPVKIHYEGSYPPRVHIVKTAGKVQLSIDTVAMLDFSRIGHVDVIVSPFSWEMNGKTGVKAYLVSMYAFLAEDELDLRYGDIPTIGV